MVTIAQYGLIICLSIFLIFHICVLLQIIPYSIVWGGRLKSKTEMYRFETNSILVNLIFIGIILEQAQLLTFGIPQKALTIMLWIMAALFLFNTLGNAVSKNKLEQKLFTPITLLLAILSLILALSS